MQIQAAMEGKRTQIISENAGELEQMGVEFREVDPFNLWVSCIADHIRPCLRCTLCMLADSSIAMHANLLSLCPLCATLTYLHLNACCKLCWLPASSVHKIMLYLRLTSTGYQLVCQG